MIPANIAITQQSTVLKTGLFCLFCLILFILPLPLGSNRPWAWSLSQSYIFILTFLCISFYWQEFSSAFRAHKPVVICLVVVTAYLFLQQIPLPVELLEILSPNTVKYLPSDAGFGHLSFDRHATASAMLKLASYLCIFCIALFFLNTPEKIQQALLFMVITGAVQGFYGAFEVLSGQDKTAFFDFMVNPRANGSFVYHNHFANFLMLCLCAGMGYFITSLSRRQYRYKSDRLKATLFALTDTKTMVRIMLMIMVIALVMSRSRMGNTAFFSSFLIVSLIYFFRGKSVPGGFKILVVSMLIIDTFIVSAWFGLDKVKERIEGTSIEAESRDEVYRDAMKIVEDFPLTGTGGGSFETIFSSYQSEDIKLFYDHAHNDYIQFMVEYGIPVTGLLGAMMAYVIYLAAKVLVTRQRRQLTGPAAAALMAFIGMLIHMSVDFPLLPPANASFLMVFIAIACNISKMEIAPRRKREH